MKRRTASTARLERLLAKSQQVVLARSGGRCEKCQWAGRPLQVHHRRPRGLGGSSLEWINLPASLVAVCVECHNGIESNRALAYEEGWLLPYAAVDASAPLTWWWVTPRNTFRKGFAVLDDLGNVTEVAPSTPEREAA